MSVSHVLEREAQEVRDTPFGSVGVLHDGRDLKAWWIWKDGEEIDPSWKAFDREDFLYVVRGRSSSSSATIPIGKSSSARGTRL